MTASQRAMATAVIYPETEKLKRKGGDPSSERISTGLLAKARAVLGTEFVQPTD